MTEQKASSGMSATALKIIAVVCMLIDHIAVAFVPRDSFLGLLMHLIGRLTTPIMAFFIAEGYYKTRNVTVYALRLFIFELISHIPYNWFLYGSLQDGFRLFPASVMFSLLCGLLALWAWDKIEFVPGKILVSVGLILLSYRSDSYIFAATYVLVFGALHGKFSKQMIAFAVAALIPIGFNIYYYGYSQAVIIYRLVPYIGSYFAIPLLSMYNGERGISNAFSKWGFYILYPLQFVVLALLCWGV